jgi:CheY-like chemotaxis protein
MKPAKILIIDRDPDTLLFLKNLLHSSGHTPFCASSVEEGMIAAEKDMPDLVILEAMMPGPGRQKQPSETCECFGGIPVLLCSYLTKESFLRFQWHKAPLRTLHLADPDAYLEKPLEKEDLLETIHLLLDKKPQQLTE